MAIEKLSARKVDALKAPGRYSDGGGLWLQVAPSGSKCWIYQFASPTKRKSKIKKNGKEVEVGYVRQLGLGALHTISLAEARELAATYRKQVAKGIDPLAAKEAQRLAKRSEEVALTTFKSCAEKYLAAHRASWKNAKHREQWASTLETYAYPFIGDLSVAAINTPQVLLCIEPLWADKTETASRLRGRIERVLDWAKVSGFRTGDNPARWKGHLDHRLPQPAKTTRRKHLPALHYADLARFLSELKAHKGISPRALEVTILTALRTSEVINATWDEIDLRAKVWTVPAERMKGNREHRVPLCDRIVTILRALPRDKGNPYVFFGGKSGQPLSNMAMLELLKELRPGLTVHGFRSTYRTWASEQTNYPYEVCEVVLAHAVGSTVHQAYQRGDLFEKRRKLMVEWAQYCAKPSRPRIARHD
jgi:integrase